MPLDLPIDELIIVDLCDALKAISIDDDTDYTIRPRVQRIGEIKDPLQWSANDEDIVIVAGDPVPDAGDDQPALRNTTPASWTMQIGVFFYAMTSDSSEDPYDRKLRIGASDIIRKVMQDPQRGGNATRINLDVVEYDYPARMVGVGFDIVYESSRTDPTQKT